MNMWLNDGVY